MDSQHSFATYDGLPVWTYPFYFKANLDNHEGLCYSFRDFNSRKNALICIYFCVIFRVKTGHIFCVPTGQLYVNNHWKNLSEKTRIMCRKSSCDKWCNVRWQAVWSTIYLYIGIVCARVSISFDFLPKNGYCLASLFPFIFALLLE